MKVLHFLLSLLIIVNYMENLRSEDGLELMAMKRPFCNAFTGCGRKRDPAYAGPGYGSVQVPVPVYRALLRFAEVGMRQQQDGPDLQLAPIF